MKYMHKCTCCHRKATGRKYKGRYFCDDCKKRVRKDKPKYVWTDKLVYTLGPGCAIYSDYPVKLK